MNPVRQAIWIIESNFHRGISLAEVAETVGVSKFHLVRAFGYVTGFSVKGYVRARRLSEAARTLATSPASVLEAALDAGYGSHEAFTRAFRQHFGVTPESVRAARSTQSIKLVEPFKMNDTPIPNLDAPRFEDAPAMLIVGVRRRYSADTTAGIPAQWQEFVPHFGHVPNQKGDLTYGVCCNADDEGHIDYIAGVEVSSLADTPGDLAGLKIAPQHYAVFEHRGHISDISKTWSAILSKWLPDSEREPAEAPQFERYGADFDARTGNGRVEIWIPVT